MIPLREYFFRFQAVVFGTRGRWKRWPPLFVLENRGWEEGEGGGRNDGLGRFL